MSHLGTLTPPPVTRPAAPQDHTPPRRGWAWAGLAAGVCGLAVFGLAGMVSAPESAWADNADLVTHLADGKAGVWIFQVVTVVAAGLLVVFGAGLRRHLYAQAPVNSLLPDVALIGTALTAAMLLVGGGISTELFWGLLQDTGKIDPDTIAADLAIFNTIGWVWAAMGLTAGSVAVAALRHGALPRWLGWTSVVLTGLVVATQVVPLQYMALVPGALWLVVAGAALIRRERPA